MQVFLGQAWADHNADFLKRALQADRITFADLGVVRCNGGRWAIENPSNEAAAFAGLFDYEAA